MSKQRMHTHLERQRNQEIEQQPIANLSPVPESVYDVLESDGQSLDSETRAFMEPRFGHDFSQVRIHADSHAAESARDVDALAYTVGNQIVFGASRYAPETPQGQCLLAHELTHVVQQNGSPSFFPEIGAPDTPYEHEAARAASAVMAGQHPEVQSGTVGDILQRNGPGEQEHQQHHHGDEHTQSARPSAQHAVHVPTPPRQHLTPAQIQQLNQSFPPLLRFVPPESLRVEPQVTPEPLQFKVTLPTNLSLLRLMVGRDVEFDIFNQPGAEFDFSRSLLYPQDFAGAQANVNLLRLHLGSLVDLMPQLSTGMDNQGHLTQQGTAEVDFHLTDQIQATFEATWMPDGTGHLSLSSLVFFVGGRIPIRSPF